MKTFSVALGITSLLVSCSDPVSNRMDQCRKNYENFQSEPSEEHLRLLINVETDASVTGLQMALVGQAFAEHPEVFRKIAPNPKSENEIKIFQLLRNSPDLLFDYHPNYKPDSFDMALREATWLGDMHNMEGD